MKNKVKKRRRVHAILNVEAGFRVFNFAVSYDEPKTPEENEILLKKLTESTEGWIKEIYKDSVDSVSYEYVTIKGLYITGYGGYV